MDAFIDSTIQLLIEWGLPGLFISALLAGSIIPFSSELVLVALVKLGLNPTACILAAALGNTAGGMTCYYMGRLGKISWIEKYFKVKKEKVDKMMKFLQGKGALMAFFAFLPAVGEVISIALGFMRSNVWLTTASMFAGKLIRYILLLYVLESAWNVVEKTDDGSATLFVPELNEHYHSTKGARTESQHIFINMGLKASDSPSPHILEIGFGTGLNAWLTLEEAERSGRNVHYTGLELYPLEWQMVEQLGYIGKENDEHSAINSGQQAAIDLFRGIHTSPWEEEISFTPHFTLCKIQADVNKWIMNNEQWAINRTITQHSHSPLSIIHSPLSFDVIYFDAFAPEKQPEMWSQELFNRLYVLLNEGGILTTYCAKGVIRRMLQAAGFTVERLPGPPGGKREILRALKPKEKQEAEI